MTADLNKQKKESANLKIGKIEMIKSEQQEEGRKVNRAYRSCGTPSGKPTYALWKSQKEMRKEQKEYLKK